MIRMTILIGLLSCLSGCGERRGSRSSPQPEPLVPEQPAPTAAPIPVPSPEPGPSPSPAPTAPDAPPPDSPRLDDEPQRVPYSHVLFTGFDPSAAPWQMSLYRLDLATRHVEKLLSGESGDTALYYGGGEALLFNRSFDSQNYRRLRAPAAHLEVAGQRRFAGGDIGDPHDALFLGDDQVLLAHYVKGALSLMRTSDGRLLQEVKADWDLPRGAKLRPEALLLVEREGRRFVYVVHQAYGIGDGVMRANGSQQVFVLEQRGGRLEPVDLDAGRPKIQGIRLKGSFPLPVRSSLRSKPLLVSLCSRWIADGGGDANRTCHGAVEELDPATHTVTTLWDLDGLGLYMNGPVVGGPDEAIFHAHVEVAEGGGTPAKKVLRFDLKSRTYTPVHEFAQESGGYYAALYDEVGKALYLGDLGQGSLGRFVIIREDGGREELALEQVPYAGVLVPKAP